PPAPPKPRALPRQNSPPPPPPPPTSPPPPNPPWPQAPTSCTSTCGPPTAANPSPPQMSPPPSPPWVQLSPASVSASAPVGGFFATLRRATPPSRNGRSCPTMPQ